MTPTSALSAASRRTSPPVISALMKAALADPTLISLAAGFVDQGSLPVDATAGAIADVLADLVGEGAVGSSLEKERLAAWETMLRTGAETFILAVQAFYAGPLMEAIFAENKHTALRRSITSLLAGDVFTDAVWLRDTRLRLKEMLDAPAS